MSLIRKQKNGFGKDKGVLNKIMDAIDVEEEEIYLVPSSSSPRVRAFPSTPREAKSGRANWLAQSKLEV